MQQQRYFIGMTLPSELSKAIATVQHDIYIPDIMLLPLTPHITLIEPNLLTMLPAEEFIPKVKDAASQFLPFTISLDQTSLFGKQVFYIDVKNEELAVLEMKLLKLLSDTTYGAVQINRPFQPHVTIAQAKYRQRLPLPLIESLRTRIEPLLPQKFSVHELVYFQWVHPRSYALYEI